MPSVPRYNQRQVQESVGPAIQQNANAPREAFGISEQPQRMVNGLSEVIQKAKNDADQVAITDIQSKLSSFRTTAEWDPSNGYYNKRGKDAIESVNGTLEAFDKKVAELEESLTPSQAMTFKRVAANERSQMYNGFQRHLSSQIREYDDETTKSLINNEADSAIANFQNPESVGYSLQKIEGAIFLSGQRNGAPAEAIKLQVQNARSQVHAGIISRYLNQGDDREAKAYFEQHKESLTGTDTARLEKDLEVGSLRGESQRLSDEIFSQSPSLSQALEKARRIEDPELRDETTRRIQQNFQMKDAIDRDNQEKRSINISNLLDQNQGDINKIPPAEWNKMSASEKSSWRNYANSVSKGQEPTTNWSVYSKLKSMDPAEFNNIDIVGTYRNQLGNTELKELINLQTGSRNGDSKARKELDGFVSDQKIVDQVAFEAGLNANAKNGEAKKRYDRYLEAVNKEVTAIQRESGKKLLGEEVRNVAKRMAFEGITEEGFLFDTKKRVSDMTIDEVPNGDRKKIIEALKAKKQPVTEQSIIFWYLQKNSKAK